MQLKHEPGLPPLSPAPSSAGTRSLERQLRRVGARCLPTASLVELVFESGRRITKREQAARAKDGAATGALSLETLDVSKFEWDDFLAQGLSPRIASRVAAAVELGRRAARVKRSVTRLECREDVWDWAERRLVHLDHEEIWILSLDAKNGLKSADRVAQGGVHACAVSPADVLRPAIRNAAACVLLVHNHPSGDPTPSRADVSMTAHLARVCELLGVPLLDHVVVAREGACSVPLPSPLQANEPASDLLTNNTTTY